MIEVFAAFTKALRDLATPGVLWHAIWPALLSMAGWSVAGSLLWPWGMVQLEHLVPSLPWSGWEWVSQWASTFLLLAALAMLIYVTIIVLVAVVVLPLLINRIAIRDYPDLTRHGSNVMLGSLANTVLATLVFVLGSLLCLPLLLIPGAVLVIPLAWTAWLNQRTFRFDALAEHATSAELKQLVQHERGGFYLAGFCCALLAHVPVLNLVVPAITALVFVHLGLLRLRALRQLQGVQL